MIELVNVKPLRGAEQFSVQIESGSMVCIGGDYRNNILRIMAGLDMPHEGSVLVNDYNLVQMKEDARTIFRRQYMSYLYNTDNLLDNLTVKENIIFVSQLNGQNINNNELLKITNQLQISNNMLEKYPSALSVLQKFIVTLARGLVSNHLFIFVEDLDLLHNVRYIEDYYGIIKDVNQTNKITIVITLADSEKWPSLFGQKIIC